MRRPTGGQEARRPGGRGFNPRRGRQHSFVEIDLEIFSTVILSLPLIHEGQLLHLDFEIQEIFPIKLANLIDIFVLMRTFVYLIASISLLAGHKPAFSHCTSEFVCAPL